MNNYYYSVNVKIRNCLTQLKTPVLSLVPGEGSSCSTGFQGSYSTVLYMYMFVRVRRLLNRYKLIIESGYLKLHHKANRARFEPTTAHHPLPKVDCHNADSLLFGFTSSYKYSSYSKQTQERSTFEKHSWKKWRTQRVRPRVTTIHCVCIFTWQRIQTHLILTVSLCSTPYSQSAVSSSRRPPTTNTAEVIINIACASKVT